MLMASLLLLTNTLFAITDFWWTASPGRVVVVIYSLQFIIMDLMVLHGMFKIWHYYFFFFRTKVLLDIFPELCPRCVLIAP